MSEFDDVPKEIEETEEFSPTEYIPVMRHHAAHAQMVIDNAYMVLSAEDLAQSYREGRAAVKPSALAAQLLRSSNILREYLGIGVVEEADDA